MRHLRPGEDTLPGGDGGGDEIGLAVIATSFTLIAVFLPTAFMSGVPGSSSCNSADAAIAVFLLAAGGGMLTR